MNSSTVQKNRIKNLLSVIALVVSLALCAGGVYAWLSDNRDLDTNGLEMTANASANLVISTTNTDVAGGILDPDILTSASPFTVSFSAETTEMVACMHASSGGTYLLKYCKTPEGIAYNTGLPLSGSLDTLLENVPQADGYFRDCTVYIASAGSALSDVDLTVTVTATNVAAGATLTDTHKALTVDFYVGGTAASNYRGTLNVAGLYSDNTGTPHTSLSIFTGDIPENVAPDGYLTVVMRVYFDGNLQKPGGTQTYVTSQSLSTADLGITVQFSALPAEN